MHKNKVVQVGIVGVAGYAGMELCRLLLGHPGVKLTHVFSESQDGKPLGAAAPGLDGVTDLVCKVFSPADAAQCDVIFFAQESGFAMSHAGKLVDAGVNVIDLSADFRLRDPLAFQHWYGKEHTAVPLLSRAVYGLPELYREQIRSAKLVANPGCYPTGAALALVPLIEAGWIETDQIVVSSLSGVSGAGRSKQTLAYHYPELNESMSAYGVGGKHRHTPEIEQTLTDFADTPVSISFTPHLIPVTRGILTTASAKLNAERSSAEVIGLFANKYAGERFVAVNLDGTTPSTKQVLGSNRVRIGAAVDEHIGRVVVIAVEDNLLKGAAGQAVQNMNIMLGLAEDAGLPLAATWP